MLKKCKKCGALIEVIKNCGCQNCGISCCGEQMNEVLENYEDASVEKHLPVIEVIGKYIVVSVNHVMENEHYIEYISLEAENINAKKFFRAGETPKAVFPYIKGCKVLSYCNKHGLWSKTVE